MRRFDDFLKLLLSILIGQVLKEQDEITEHLSKFLLARAPGGLSESVAYCAPFLMVALYLRNIHGSICYDIWQKREGKFVIPYERNAAGRGIMQVLSLLALFVIPFAAVHTLDKHEGKDISAAILAALLLGPVVVYAIWNFALWFSTDREELESLRLYKTIRRWLKIDVLCLVLCEIGLIYWLASNAGAASFRVDVIAAGLAGMVAFVVLFDYLINREFYFPSSDEPRQDKTSPETGRGAPILMNARASKGDGVATGVTAELALADDVAEAR